MNIRKVDTANPSLVNWAASEYSCVGTIAPATAATADNRNRDPQIGARRVPGQSPGRRNFAHPAKPTIAVNRRLAGTRAVSTCGSAMWPSCSPILISEISDRVTLARSAMNRRRKAAAWSVIQLYKNEVGKRDQRHQQ